MHAANLFFDVIHGSDVKRVRVPFFPSLGYIRDNYTTKSEIFIQALVDSGNLFGDIMCEKLAKMLKLQYNPCSLKAGTAVSGQQVQILGKTNPMDLILEGLPTPESPIAPFVIRIVFETNKAEIKFEGTKVTLKLINKLIELVNRSLPVVGNSTNP